MIVDALKPTTIAIVALSDDFSATFAFVIVGRVIYRKNNIEAIHEPILLGNIGKIKVWNT